MVKPFSAHSICRRLPRTSLSQGIVAAVALLCSVLSSLTALSPNGRILNQASGEYTEPATAITYPLLSNLVEVQVGIRPDVSLEADRTIYGGPGANVVMNHILTNTGNVTVDYTLSLSLEGEDGFYLENAELWWDINANGAPDLGEQVLARATTPVNSAASFAAGFTSASSAGSLIAPDTLRLQAGESAALLIVARIPILAVDGQITKVKVKAESLLYRVAATNTDTVVVSTSPVQIRKSVSSGVAARGDEVVWIVDTFISGTAQPIGVNIDGNGAQRIIVRDVIPVNTTFIRFVQNNGGQPLFNLHGKPLHQYQSDIPEDLSTIAAVAWAFESVRPGQSLRFSFATNINQNASDSVPNTAYVYYHDGEKTTQLESNLVTVRVPLSNPVIRYFTNEKFVRIAPITRLGRDLYVQADAAACNRDPLVVEQVIIGIFSKLTGDEEFYTATETGPNTGVFRIMPPVPTDDGTRVEVVKRNGILESATNDVLTAFIRECGGTITSTIILVDPIGIVFDSRTNEPVSGVKVTLIDITGQGNGGKPGQPAEVIAEDLESSAPSTVVTGSDGIFFFPLVAESRYKVILETPEQYTFPSTVSSGLLMEFDRNIVQPASWGGEFQISQELGAFVFDVPLDPKAADGFLLTKEVSRNVAEIGDSVIYTLTLKNSSSALYRSVRIEDRLPHGFFYEEGSTVVDGVPALDPTGGRGPRLTFYIGQLDSGEETVVQYRVRLGPGANKGTGINRAQAISFGPPLLYSNEARVKVRVEEGVFTDKGIIFGRVFVDNDDDLLPSENDLGVPGVRIYLEDGTYAITDREGKYSIYGQRPVAHIVKLDPFTLPRGAQLNVIDSRNAGDAGSRFADLKNGELHKANFAVAPSESILKEVERRREIAKDGTSEITQALERNFEADGRTPVLTDRKALASSGTVKNQSRPAYGYESLLPPGTLNGANSRLPNQVDTTFPAIDLSILAAQNTDAALDFVDLKDGDTLPIAYTDIRVKGVAGTTFKLTVNDAEVSQKRLGKFIQNPSTGVQFAEYIGIALKPGANRIALAQLDDFGNARGTKEITVYAPDNLAKIRLEFSELDPIADGATPLRVGVHLEDAEGRRVTSRIPLTLESDYGKWEVEDLNPNEPGVQAFLTGGYGEFALMPNTEPGAARIVISSGVFRAEKRIRFMAQMRPFVTAGIAEVRANFSSGDSAPGEGGATEIDKGSPFEDRVSEIATFSDGDVTGRVAAFAKGEVKDGWLLTASYDSAKDRDGDLFRDIEPDAYFPIYGDESVRGFEAQSTSPLFARLENKNNYIQWGDFTTAPQSGDINPAGDVRSLGSYNRSLTGVSSHYENDRVSLNAWAAYTASRRVVVEIPANGTSGPFSITAAGDGFRNTEVVEIITRDRNQPALILQTRALERFTDYEFEPFTGRLLLRAPVASLDSNMNPQSIRITYEMEEEGGEKAWVWGVDGQVRITDRWEVGASYAEDQNLQEQYNLSSVNSTIKLGENTYLLGEVARSEGLDDNGVMTDGLAGRVELRHTDGKTDARIYAGKAEEDFQNDTALLTAGRVEAGFEVTRQLRDNYQLKTEGIYSEDVASSGTRKGVRLDVAKTFDNHITVEVGGRVSEESATPASADTAADPTTVPNKVRSVRLKVGAPVPFVKGASVYGEIENDVQETDNRILAVGADYQVKAKTRIYARHEFIDSLGGEFQINSTQQNNRTLFGVESEYMKGGQLFNEYRVRDSIGARDAEAATGLRNKWDVAPGFDLNTSFERTTPFDGKTEKESTSGTVSLGYTERDDWKASTRVEVRFSDATDTFLHTFGYAHKMNENWTFLTRTIYFQQENSGVDSRDMQQARLLTGFAYRPIKNDTWNALFRYEIKYEDGSLDFKDDLKRIAHIGAVSWNWQPEKRLIVSGRYAAKYVEEDRSIGDSSYFGHLLGGRVLFDVTKRIDAGLSASVFFNGASDNFEYALGPEIGLNFRKNMRLAVGYNFFGYEDRDFEEISYSREGLFITLRLKFDENFFRDLWGSDSKKGGDK